MKATLFLSVFGGGGEDTNYFTTVKLGPKEEKIYLMHFSQNKNKFLSCIALLIIQLH